MAAKPVLRIKQAHRGGVIEIVVWDVPAPVRPSVHGFKYRLVFVRSGKRMVGYDNEFGKGDHRHIGEVETPYRFIDVDTLLADFWRDVTEATR
jgi:hypothetical protein